MDPAIGLSAPRSRASKGGKEDEATEELMRGDGSVFILDSNGRCRKPRRPYRTRLGRDPKYLVHGTAPDVSVSSGSYRWVTNPDSLGKY